MTSKFTVTASPMGGVKVEVIAQHFDSKGKVTSEQTTQVPAGETKEFDFFPGVQLTAREYFEVKGPPASDAEKKET